MAGASAGQARLDRIVKLIASSMETEVCSIYLFRDSETLELCATEGLKAEAVHVTRMRLGEGLVGRVARRGRAINAANAPQEPGFRYMPETGEERYSSFLGVPVQRLGEKLGVLVVQSKTARTVHGRRGLRARGRGHGAGRDDRAWRLRGRGRGAVGAAPPNPSCCAARPGRRARPRGMSGCTSRASSSPTPSPTIRWPRPSGCTVRWSGCAGRSTDAVGRGGRGRRAARGLRDLPDVRQFARLDAPDGRGHRARALGRGGGGEGTEPGAARMEEVADAYLRDRLHDLDDLSNRLLRILTGQGAETGAELPSDPILVARNIGPGELLEYGRKLRGIVLEQGSVGSHAAIVARAWAIPLVIHAERITAEALNGDHILIDGDQGLVHLRPDDTVRGRSATRWRCRPRRRSATSRCATCRPRRVRRGRVASDERRPDGGPALARGVGGRGGGAVPHRASVPRAQQGAQAGRVGRALFPGDGQRRRAVGSCSARSTSGRTRCCPT
jgi:phosphotransferase system, enzyme I, PtsP